VTVIHAARTDATATIDPSARIDPTAVIGPGCVIEAGAFIGPRCVLGPQNRVRPYAIIAQDTELGARNDVHSTAVLGGDPQDRAFKPEVPGRLIIGDDNIFREGVTISRGTGDEIPTRIGSHCYFMAASHAGHNVQMGSHITLANGVLIAGHARIGDRVNFGGGALVHQFVCIGELAMFQGGGQASMHVPPYALVTRLNIISGINAIGLRRTGVTPEQREQVKAVFKIVLRDRSGTPIRDRIAAAAALPLDPPATRFVEFVRDAIDLPAPRARGLCEFEASTGATRVADTDE
jgi:UDP-N-acetylglucosamine acyltransferase